ncbi:MAG: hypothetical protein KTR15_13665 [Phycisphaeraceae bacterium]|nr:hypothetical protein [Phycisphaeraceae bacterium]
MSTRLIQLAALIITAAGILCAFMLSPVINQQRVDRQLTYDLEGGSSAHPSYTLAASLGSFRGVLINILWQRSEALKQEGKFFESNNLAEYITTLQPRFPDAWDIQAWNMAYNISVKCKTAEERWDWVQKGMVLLRDRGIPNNPNAVVLYRSIAWILGHKMAGGTDDMHWYYKARMAETWQTILGAPDPGWGWKPEYRDPAKRPLEEDFDRLEHGEWLATRQFAQIADMAETYLKKANRTEGDFRASNYFTTLSPDNLARFYTDYPDLKPVVQQLEALKGPGGEELELGLNPRTLRAFGRGQMFRDAGYDVGTEVINNPDVLGIDAMAVYKWIVSQPPDVALNLNPRNNIAAARERNPDLTIVDLVPLLNLLRALTLVGEYHMDPPYMLVTMQAYGPIDWRHPAAHAMYWSALGTLRAEEWTQNKGRIDLLNANRNIIHNLQKLAHEGKINFRPQVPTMGQIGKETINHSPDVRMIPAYDRAWEDTLTKAKAGDFGDKHEAGDSFANGHENFLQSAVYLYYYDGQETKARDYFKRAKEIYADSPTSPVAEDGEYELSMPDFARVRFDDDLGFQNVMRILVRIRLAWRYGLAERSRAVMKRHLDSAKRSYDDYLEERQITARADLDVQARQNIPPFEDLVLSQFIEIMGSPEQGYSLPQKANIWQLAVPLLVAESDERALVYEAYARMIPFLISQAQLEGLSGDIRNAFPPPQGFEQWYQQNVAPQQPGLPPPPQPNPTR